MGTVTVSEARANLRALLEQVARGEEIVVTQHGAEVAVLVHPRRLRARRADALMTHAADLRRRLDRAEPRGPGLVPGRADELVAELRADRDAS
jgi:prevent-host-death family protein